MRTIKFTDPEIELLIMLYQDELQATENYIRQIKNLLTKLHISDAIAISDPIATIQKKRGPNPKPATQFQKKRYSKQTPVKQNVLPLKVPVIPVQVKEHHKESNKKEKIAEPKHAQAGENIQFIPPIEESIHLLPVVPEPETLNQTGQGVPPPPPQEEFVCSPSEISVQNEDQKAEDVVDTAPNTPNPFLKFPFPLISQNVKKKKFRPKRPCITLKNLSKPLILKEYTNSMEFEESQENAE